MKYLLLACMFLPGIAISAAADSTASYAVEVLRHDCKTAAGGARSFFQWPQGINCNSNQELVSIGNDFGQIPLIFVFSSVLKKDMPIDNLQIKGNLFDNVNKKELLAVLSSQSRADSLYAEYAEGMALYDFPAMNNVEFNAFLTGMLSALNDNNTAAR